MVHTDFNHVKKMSFVLPPAEFCARSTHAWPWLHPACESSGACSHPLQSLKTPAHNPGDLFCLSYISTYPDPAYVARRRHGSGFHDAYTMSVPCACHSRCDFPILRSPTDHTWQPNTSTQPRLAHRCQGMSLDPLKYVHT